MYTDRAGAVRALRATECLAAKARRVDRVLVARYDRRLRPVGITVAQLDLLATLLEFGGECRGVDLADRMYMDPSTISRNLSRLERVGLIATGPGRTRRERRVRVTPNGRRRAEKAFAPWREAQREAASLLGPRGIRALDVLVGRIDGREGK